MNTTFKAGEIVTMQEAMFSRLIALLEAQHYTDKAGELKERLQKLQAQEKIRVAFVGQYSAGKSTMVSALTGKEIAVGTDVTTEVSTDYEWGSFLLTDTPGLQNNDTHDAIAAEAIKNSDLIVYCITYELFNRNTLSDYLSLAYDRGYKEKMILVINKINSEETEDREELIANYTESLNKTLAPHSLGDVPHCFIDVQDYLKGVAKNKERRIIKSNFLRFIELLNEYLATNGLLCKMDTPLRMASAVIDEVRIDETESDEDRQKKILISRANRDLQRLRAEASRKWNGEVNRELVAFSGEAYDLFDRIQEGSCADPEGEFNVLLSDALERVNDTLTAFSQQYDDECVRAVGEIMESSLAQRFFGNIDVNHGESQGVIAGAHAGEHSQGSAALRKGVDLIGDSLGKMNISQAGVKNVILEVGHKFGHKFKPWGATKLAGKATKALKFLGPAMEVVGLVMDIKETVDEGKAADEQRSARQSLHNILEETKSEIRKACDEQRAEFIREVFEARLEQLDALSKQMADHNSQNHDFNVQLTEIEAEIRRIQKAIMSSVQDNEES